MISEIYELKLNHIFDYIIKFHKIIVFSYKGD